eukprot:m.81439 g.81439  ORF g.81439 m.81439 type:complete len:399 (-) comp14573_c0_seq1:98-1294(-)
MAAAVYNRDKDIQAYARIEAQKIIANVNKGAKIHFAVPNFNDPNRKAPRAAFKYFMQTLMNNPASKVRANSEADKRTFARVFIYELAAESFMGGVSPTPDVGDEIDDLLDHVAQQDIARVMETTEASPYEIQAILGDTVTFRAADNVAAYFARLRVTMNYLMAVRQYRAENGGKSQFSLVDVIGDILRVCVHRSPDLSGTLFDMREQIISDLVESPSNNFDDADALFGINDYSRALDAFFATFKVTRNIKTYRAPVSQRGLAPGNLAPPAPVGALNAMDLRHQLNGRQDRPADQQRGAPAAKRANRRDAKRLDQVTDTFISQIRQQFPSTLRFEDGDDTVDAVGYVKENLFRLAYKRGGKRNASRFGKGKGDKSSKNFKQGRKYDRGSEDTSDKAKSQ